MRWGSLGRQLRLVGVSLGGQLSSGCAHLGPIHASWRWQSGAGCPGLRGCVTLASYFPLWTLAIFSL